MYYPSFDEVLQFKNSHTMIPIQCKVWSDGVTPIRLFQQIKGKYSFLFESVEGGEKWARYSFLGNNPFLLFRVHEGKAYIQNIRQGDTEEQELEGDPIQCLKELLANYTIPKKYHFPRFNGGAVGYIGYDAISLVEELPEHEIDEMGQDTIRLMFIDEVIVYDHLQQEIIFVSLMPIDKNLSNQELKSVYGQTCRKLFERIHRLTVNLQDDPFQFFHYPYSPPDTEWKGVSSNFSKEGFMNAVERVKEYIRAGDVFQTVLSQRFSKELKTDPFNIYRVLRAVNPSPYLFYLDLGDEIQLVGSSPERLVQVEDGKIETNPIAGTRHRGSTEKEDEALAHELLADEKERAEHHMLLDLGRNDIGKMSQYGSVKVTKKMEIERFSHVMHIVSTVEGQLRPDASPIDSLFSCFPAGTVSGAPKIRAMGIIAELEKEARQAYAGAVSYFSFTGNIDSCITIRTVVVHKGVAYVQAGAGIVADSVPESEWQETRNKARAMMVAIQLAENLFEEDLLYV